MPPVGASCSIASSRKIIYSMRMTLRPPYSFGHAMVSQPCLVSCFSNFRASPALRLAAVAPQYCWRNCWTSFWNACSSLFHEKSIVISPGEPAPTTACSRVGVHALECIAAGIGWRDTLSR